MSRRKFWALYMPPGGDPVLTAVDGGLGLTAPFYPSGVPLGPAIEIHYMPESLVVTTPNALVMLYVPVPTERLAWRALDEQERAE